MKKLLLLTVFLLVGSDLVQAQKITVLLPNGGETMTQGSMQLISWTYSKISGNNTILIALEGKTDSGPIAYSKVAQGSIEWLAGKKMDGTYAKPANDYQIVIEIQENDYVFDVSDSTFTITPAVSGISLLTPNGGESLERGKDFYINWAFAGSNAVVNLTLIKDNLPLGLIAENLPASNFRYRWNVGNPLLNHIDYSTGKNFRIEIQLSYGKDKPMKMPSGAMAPAAAAAVKNSDRSDGSFSIKNPQDSVKSKI